jgi:hypothetical protein
MFDQEEINRWNAMMMWGGERAQEVEMGQVMLQVGGGEGGWRGGGAENCCVLGRLLVVRVAARDLERVHAQEVEVRGMMLQVRGISLCSLLLLLRVLTWCCCCPLLTMFRAPS